MIGVLAEHLIRSIGGLFGDVNGLHKTSASSMSG
jgi:hypothetical protein